MRLLCTSDLHSDFEALKKICDVANGFDAVVVAGDLTNFGSAKVALHMIGELKSKVKNLFLVPGNCDLEETSELYRDMDVSLHGLGKVYGEIGFFGVGGSNPTPFNTPLEYSEEDIRSMLEEGYEAVKDSKVKILVSHPPPFESVDKTSSGHSAGSRAVREFMKGNRIDLVVCGHIHEAKGSKSVGDAMVVNTGPACYGYVEATIDEEDGRVSYKFVGV